MIIILCFCHSSCHKSVSFLQVRYPNVKQIQQNLVLMAIGNRVKSRSPTRKLKNNIILVLKSKMCLVTSKA